MIVSYKLHLKNFFASVFKLGFKAKTSAKLVQCSHKLRYMKPLRHEQVNALGSCVPMKGMMSVFNMFVKCG